MSCEKLEDAVKPERRDEWPEVHKKWFAVDEKKHPTQKIPGYLKEEFRSEDGWFIGLSSKCYILTAGEKIKRSQKGTPKNQGMSLEQFSECLLNNEIPTAQYSSIMQDKNQGSCVTKIISKRALNPVYYKHRVHDNCIDISPFKDGDNYF